MNYFMLVWEYRDNHDMLPNHKIHEILKEHVGKTSTNAANTSMTENIAEIGEDLQLLTSQISNVVFLQTDNSDLTENAIAHWLSQEIGAGLFYNRNEIYVKQVSDPYPLLKLPRQFL